MSKTAKTNLAKWIATLSIIFVNLLLWVKPCDLAYNVAQHRHILLGRYTVDRLTTLLLLLPVGLLIIRGIWSPKTKTSQKEKRQRLFRTIALSASVIFSIFIADIFLRIIQQRRYVANKSYYHRVPNTIDKGTNRDIPPTAFSYPATPPGYHDIEYTLTIDKRGFRNQTNLEKYDVVVLGDSFTEGSHVSDAHVWPALFAQKSNRTVYNLGMSGGRLVTYLETLKKFGLQLSPDTVICTLYEGNDFRASNFADKKNRRRRNLHTFYKTSPLRHSIKKALIRCLGPANSNRFKKIGAANADKTDPYTPSHPLYAVSWLPLAVPDGPDAKYYAFKIKRLLSHFESRDNFLHSPGCQATFTALRQIKKICNEKNIRLIITYIPDKPHTLLPLVKHKLSPEKLHAFMALKKKNLPPADELTEILPSRLHAQQSVIEEFCRQESIEFISLTQPLRQEILKGSQTYYTYDQHWTPIGHKIAANTLYRYLENTSREKSSIAITQ